MPNLTAVVPAPSASPIPGTNTMLIGPSGAGKTWSIRSIVASGITPFCVFTEPGFQALGDIPPDKLHWHYIAPASVPWEAMIQSASYVNSLSYESLTKLSDNNRGKYKQFVDLLRCFNSYTCQRTGENFGPVESWGTDRCLVLDGLSGAGIMSMNLVVGGKPTRSQPEWGVAMDNLERLINKLCTDTQCHFVLIAHIERELDEALGGSKIMASTLGKKLAPKLPRFFSDVVLAVKEADRFTWSTAAIGADLVARNLPIKDGLVPSFGQIFDSWKKNGGVICPAVGS